MKNRSGRQEASLWEKLLEYESHTQMTEQERQALHEWVHDRNSVYENGSMGTDDTGRPLPIPETIDELPFG